jgi:hypothetical protein
MPEGREPRRRVPALLGSRPNLWVSGCALPLFFPLDIPFERVYNIDVLKYIDMIGWSRDGEG